MLVIIFEQIFLLYFDAGGRSLLIGDCLENCWLATSNSCNNSKVVMKNVTSFYSKRDIKFTKYCTLNEAINHASNNEITEIVALPPKAGNQEIDSVIEDLPDDYNGNTVNLSSIFESTGEVEVININENDFASASSVEVARPKRRKTSTKLLKKATNFDKDISAKPLGNFADAYQHLLVHSPCLATTHFHRKPIIGRTRLIWEFQF